MQILIRNFADKGSLFFEIIKYFVEKKPTYLNLLLTLAKFLIHLLCS